MRSTGFAAGRGVSERRRYDESVSSLTPQQEPESRRYELDPIEPHDDYPVRDYEPIHPRSPLRELGKKLWVPIAGLGYLLFKFKAAALVVFKLKIFATSATMLVSIAAYAWIWGWRFAVGFVLLLLVHELGHVIELRHQGIPASAPLFIPFLGAVVGMKQMPHDVWREARVALAGPILGSLGAAAVWAAGESLDSELLVALAFTGFFLNLFNLIPVSPLDGGRAVAALHPALWAVGLADAARPHDPLAEPDPHPRAPDRRPGGLAALEGSAAPPARRSTTRSPAGSGPSSASRTSGSRLCSRSQ